MAKFDLSSVTADLKVVKSYMSLYMFKDEWGESEHGHDVYLQVRNMTKSFNEATACGALFGSGSNMVYLHLYGESLSNTLALKNDIKKWYDLDIPAKYTMELLSGAKTNHGFQLRAIKEQCSFRYFYSSEYSGNVTLRPKFVIISDENAKMLTVKNGSGSGYYSIGDTAIIKGVSSDTSLAFATWSGDISTIINPSSKITKIVVMDDITVTAEFGAVNNTPKLTSKHVSNSMRVSGKFLTVSLSNYSNKNYKLQLYTLDGKLVSDLTNKISGKKSVIDLSDFSIKLSNRLYICVFSENKTIQTERILLK